ncbi:MAG: hypothetical protein HIU91_00450 [Acidobacteria bacterium]|nr:hypothetical protein [Acidobacteriota bacterium]
MLKTIYLSSVIVLLFVSGVWHIAAPKQTTGWMNRERGIRILGAIMLEMSIPCVAWGGLYFWILFVGLTVSGFMRFCRPQVSLAMLSQRMPGWLQAGLLVEGATLVWALRF